MEEADIAYFQAKGKAMIYRPRQPLVNLKIVNNKEKEFVIHRGNIHFFV